MVSDQPKSCKGTREDDDRAERCRRWYVTRPNAGVCLRDWSTSGGSPTVIDPRKFHALNARRTPRPTGMPYSNSPANSFMTAGCSAQESKVGLDMFFMPDANGVRGATVVSEAAEEDTDTEELCRFLAE